MKTTTLSMLMTVKLHSDEILDFDPEDAITHWYKKTTTSRMPRFKEKNQALAPIDMRMAEIESHTQTTQPLI